MTDLTALSIDKNVKENTGEFKVVPSGRYRGCLIGDELKDNSKKTGKILELKLQITHGEHANHVLKDMLNILNPSVQCQAIGQGTLKRICNILKADFPPSDTGLLMGKPIEFDVKVEEFTSNNTGKKLKNNKITSYHPVKKEPVTATAGDTDNNTSAWG